MKSKLTITSVALLLLIGIGVLLYPKVSDLISRWTSSASIRSYVEQVADMGDAQREQELAEARAYNEALAAGEIDSYAYDSGLNGAAAPEAAATANPWAARVPMLADGAMIGYLRIPGISVYLPVYHGTSTEVLEKGVGHLDNTSLPVGGPSTHAVLSGHTGLPTADLLTDLDQVKIGDLFYMHVLGENLAYVVDQITVVLPMETDDLLIVPGGDYLTLVTCTPYGINSHRLLVRGVRTEYVETEEVAPTTVRTARNEATILPAYAFAAVAAALYALGALFRRLRRLDRS